MEKDLLEELRKKVRCAYISDLRTPKYNKKVRRHFKKVKLTNYKQSVVDDARNYLFETEQLTHANTSHSC